MNSDLEAVRALNPQVKPTLANVSNAFDDIVRLDSLEPIFGGEYVLKSVGKAYSSNTVFYSLWKGVRGKVLGLIPCTRWTKLAEASVYDNGGVSIHLGDESVRPLIRSVFAKYSHVVIN